MAKRRDENGKSYRLRRGRWVEIPDQWVGNTTHPQTIRNRPSKQIHKLRKACSHPASATTKRAAGAGTKEGE